MFHLIDHFYPIESDLCLSNWWSLSGRPDEWAIHRSWKKTGAAAPQSLLSLEKLFWWVITPRHRHTTSKRKYLVFWESVGGSFDVVNSHMSSSWTQKSFVHQVIWWYRTWGWDNELFWRRVENSIKIPNCQNTRFQGHHCQLGRRYSATWLFNICFRLSSGISTLYLERLGCLEFCECICGTCFETNYPWLAPGEPKSLGDSKWCYKASD